MGSGLRELEVRVRARLRSPKSCPIRLLSAGAGGVKASVGSDNAWSPGVP